MIATEKLSLADRKFLGAFDRQCYDAINPTPMLYTTLGPLTFHKSRVAALFILIGILVGSISSRALGQDGETAEDPVAVFNLAQDLHEKGDLAGAVKLYEKAIKIEPAFPEALYQLGTAKLALGKTAEAEGAFRRAIDVKPDWTLAMTSLGSLLAVSGDAAEAEQLLAKVTQLEPQNGKALTALADLRRRKNPTPDSLRSLLENMTALTAKANATASLWSARADLEIALGKLADARSSVARSLVLDPKYRPALIQSGGLAVIDGDYERARQLADSINAISPGTDAVKQLNASILAGEGKLDEALKVLDTMSTPGTEAAKLRDQINTARTTSPADLEKQLDKAPKDAIILGRLCGLYRRDDPAKALDYCRRAVEADRSNVNYAVGYAAALVQGKQYDAAAPILQKIIEIVPDNFAAHANLATALFQLKRYPEAKGEFEWLTRAQPGAAGAYLFLGIIHDEAGEYIEALACYQQYVKLADPAVNRLDIEKVNLRLPLLQKQIKEKKGKK